MFFYLCMYIEHDNIFVGTTENDFHQRTLHDARYPQTSFHTLDKILNGFFCAQDLKEVYVLRSVGQKSINNCYRIGF